MSEQPTDPWELTAEDLEAGVKAVEDAGWPTDPHDDFATALRDRLRARVEKETIEPLVEALEEVLTALASQRRWDVAFPVALDRMKRYRALVDQHRKEE